MVPEARGGGGPGLKPCGPPPRCSTQELWPTAGELGKSGRGTVSHCVLTACFHHSQASRPAEPFGEEVDRKLSSQAENPQNYQPQVTTLLLQKKGESRACEKAHSKPGVTEISLETGLNFLSAPTFCARSRIDSKLAIFWQHEVYFYASTSSVCVCYVCLIQR